MLFVPLPLFVTFALLILLIRMLRPQDGDTTSSRLFALLVGLFALQSLLLCLRWGYGMAQVGLWIALVAPLLPVCAYLAYLSLRRPLRPVHLWHLGVVLVIWALRLALPDAVDPALIVIYLCYGGALIRHSRNGGDDLPLARISQAMDAARAMLLTGLALIASALIDLYVIADFIRTGGQTIGTAITVVQAVVLLAVGAAAAFGQSGSPAEDNTPPQPTPANNDTSTETDAQIVAHLEQLFTAEALHTDTDLNLRRMARRLGLPDRTVSNAINRQTGQSVSQFVNERRIQDACQMLQTSDMSVLQISLAAGFLTKSNFNREFSRVTGQTPSQWRQARKAAT